MPNAIPMVPPCPSSSVRTPFLRATEVRVANVGELWEVVDSALNSAIVSLKEARAQITLGPATSLRLSQAEAGGQAVNQHGAATQLVTPND